MVWTDPATFVAGAGLSAADLNVGLRDNLKAIGDDWTAWTPIWTAITTPPSLGNGTLIGRVMTAGKLNSFILCLTGGSTTNFGAGQWQFTGLPSPPEFQNWRWGAALWDSTLSSTYTASLYLHPLGAFSVLTPSLTAGNADRSVGGVTPFTWTTGDILTIYGTYEAS